MTIADVRRILEAEIICGSDNMDTEVHNACGSDMMSDVLEIGRASCRERVS